MPQAAKKLDRFAQAQPEYAKRIKNYARKKGLLRLLPSVDPCDIENEMLEVLWRACMTYDPNHGATFNTYFWTCAERRMLDLHRNASRQSRVGDYERIILDHRALSIAIGEYKHEFSAEDEALARMAVVEWGAR